MRRLLYAVDALTVSVDFAAAEPLVTETGFRVERARETQGFRRLWQAP